MESRPTIERGRFSNLHSEWQMYGLHSHLFENLTVISYGFTFMWWRCGRMNRDIFLLHLFKALVYFTAL